MGLRITTGMMYRSATRRLQQNIERVYDAEYSAETGFSTGDRVRHRVFGEGLVERAGTEHIVVSFERAGRKRLALSFAKLEKIG